MGFRREFQPLKLTILRVEPEELGLGLGVGGPKVGAWSLLLEKNCAISNQISMRQQEISFGTWQWIGFSRDTRHLSKAESVTLFAP